MDADWLIDKNIRVTTADTVRETIEFFFIHTTIAACSPLFMVCCDCDEESLVDAYAIGSKYWIKFGDKIYRRRMNMKNGFVVLAESEFMPIRQSQ